MTAKKMADIFFGKFSELVSKKQVDELEDHVSPPYSSSHGSHE